MPSPPRFIVSLAQCVACEHSNDGCAFQVAWSINPHMRVGAVESRHAVWQHCRFVARLEAAGAVVHALPFVHGAFDCVFSKDNALLIERQALIARPRHAERQTEQRARAEALSALGFHIDRADHPLEGGDVVMHPGARGAFLGHGFRSDRRSAATLERFLDGGVTLLELRDPRLYHLDMALSVLDDGTALLCAEAFTPAALRQIARSHAISSMIHVPFEEALRFGVNLVQIGRTIVWGADAPRTTAALAARGYRVQRTNLEQFHHAGGSAACLVARVHRRASASPVERSTAA